MSIIYTGAVFGNGAVSRILEIAATARVRDGGVSLDDELSRYSRLTKSSRVTEWAIPLATVSALLGLSLTTWRPTRNAVSALRHWRLRRRKR